MTPGTSKEQRVNVLVWIFVSDSGSVQKLSSDLNGDKYIITQTNKGSTIESQLVLSKLDESGVGSYYCQGQFSNGTTLPRSQEINLFQQIVYSHYSPCDGSKTESVNTSRCVLFVNEVVQTPPTMCPPQNSSDVSTTVTEEENMTTSDQLSTEQENNTTENGKSGAPSVMVPRQMGGGGDDSEESNDVTTILLYVAIGAVVLLIAIIVVLVLFICLCNRVCDCCRLCS